MRAPHLAALVSVIARSLAEARFGIGVRFEIEQHQHETMMAAGGGIVERSFAGVVLEADLGTLGHHLLDQAARPEQQ